MFFLVTHGGTMLFTGGNFVSRGQSVVVKFDTPNANSYKWSPDYISGVSWGTDGKNLMFTIGSGSQASFDCTVDWGCCPPVTQTFYFSVRGYSISVNSDHSLLSLTRMNNTNKSSTPDKYEIFSMSNTVVHLNGQLPHIRNEIDLMNLPSGLYIIYIHNDDFVQSQKVLINR